MTLGHRDIEALKSEARYRHAGSLAFILGKPRAYGIHYGMRDTCDAARQAFYLGWDVAACDEMGTGQDAVQSLVFKREMGR